MLRHGQRLASRWDGLADAGARVDMGEEMMEPTASIIVTTMLGAQADDDLVPAEAGGGDDDPLRDQTDGPAPAGLAAHPCQA